MGGQQRHGRPHRSLAAAPHRTATVAVAVLLSLIVSISLLYPAYRLNFSRHRHHHHDTGPLLTESQRAQFAADRAQCADWRAPAYWDPPQGTAAPSTDRVNPRYKADGSQALLLRNATVWDGSRWLGRVDLTLRRGCIASITPSSTNSPTPSQGHGRVRVMDLAGKIVTPGLVDMHSHSGVAPYPYLRGAVDVNEDSDALTPYARTIDALHPDDPAHSIIASGGVTTSLVLPGSANIIGGEGFVIKNYVAGDGLVESMLIERAEGRNRTRWIKMACGENPKRSHPSQARTRMGLSWRLRQHLARARAIIRKQDDWCARAHDPDPRVRSAAALQGLPVEPAEALEYELTTEVLRGHVRVNTHCYQVLDMEAMLRHSREFGFRIAAFHHAAEAWIAARGGLLARAGYPITQAMFADSALYKKEAYAASLHAGKILHDAGIPVAYKSDHYVTNAKYLVRQPQVAFSFGLGEDAALASVTSTPARALGLDHRIGYIRPGYDADLVVWDAHPLAVGATPLQVVIDGRLLFNATSVAATLPPHHTADTAARPPPAQNTTRIAALKARFVAAKQSGGAVIVVHGIHKSLVANLFPRPAAEPFTLVTNGTHVLCFAAKCALPRAPALEIELRAGKITPPIYAVSNELGLSEIAQEETTRDGPAPADGAVARAHYGVHFGSELLRRAYDAGVTRVITPPIAGGGLVRGISVGFFSGANSPLTGIWKSEVALHVVVGQAARPGAGSISRQMEALAALMASRHELSNGTMPLVVHAHNKDDIAQIILLTQSHPSAKAIVFGGAEAHLLAAELAAARVPVILAPWRCAPASWESRRCLVGPPTTPSPVHVLASAGVKLALAMGEDSGDDLTRGLAAEAVWAAKLAALGGGGQQEEEDAWALVSANVRDIFGIASSGEGVVIWEGDRVVGVVGE